MSGGAFEYAYNRIQIFADDLYNILEKDKKVSPEVVEVINDIAKMAERLAPLAKEAEWFYSGDIGEETFLRRVREITKAEE